MLLTLLDSPLQGRANNIMLELGTHPVNIGSTWENELRDKIVQALRNACNDSNQQGCGPNAHGGFRVFA